MTSVGMHNSCGRSASPRGPLVRVVTLDILGGRSIFVTYILHCDARPAEHGRVSPASRPLWPLVNEFPNMSRGEEWFDIIKIYLRCRSWNDNKILFRYRVMRLFGSKWAGLGLHEVDAKAMEAVICNWIIIADNLWSTLQRYHWPCLYQKLSRYSFAERGASWSFHDHRRLPWVRKMLEMESNKINLKS